MKENKCFEIKLYDFFVYYKSGNYGFEVILKKI